jgi:LPXTG-motif cell wall-anchored protein
LIAVSNSFTIIEEGYKPGASAPGAGSEPGMVSFPYPMLAEQAPGPPLIGNNLVFYSAFGGALLVVLLLILWLRRRKNAKNDEDK